MLQIKNGYRLRSIDYATVFAPDLSETVAVFSRFGECRINRGNCTVGNQGFSEFALQPLAPSDYSMVMAKSRENRLAFATWLMFFRDHGRFPRGPSDLESLDIAALARQIEVTVPADGGLLLAERTAKRLRTEIRVRYGFREATVADADSLTEWLRDHAAAEAGGEIAAMIERLEARCRELAIEPPTCRTCRAHCARSASCA